MSDALEDEDRRILRELQRDGRISNVDLARRVHMSESPCLRRTKALEARGVIRDYRARLDARRLGFTVAAYVLVNLDQRTETDQQLFFAAVADEPRIIECAALTGSYDLILKVAARDIEDLADLTMHGLLRLPTVRDIASCIVLKSIKDEAGLPL